MKAPILSDKLKDAIQKAAPDMTPNMNFYLKDITTYDSKYGCSGFVKNRENGTIVYVNTDVNFKHGYTYRYVNSTKDFVGYRSHQVKTLKELVDNVMSMLKLTLEEADERQLL